MTPDPSPGTTPDIPSPARTSSAGRDVLVVGSFPPVPTAGAAVTVDTVRALWAEGACAHVVAPRASAAPYTVAVVGPLAGRRLTRLREVTGAEDIVLCVERDLPVPTGGWPQLVLPVVQRLTVGRLIGALEAFDHVTVVACGDHGVPAAVWARLVFAADTVVDRSEVVGAPGITTLGPSESTPTDLLRHGLSLLAARMFGRRTPAVRRVVARTVHRLRAAGGAAAVR